MKKVKVFLVSTLLLTTMFTPIKSVAAEEEVELTSERVKETGNDLPRTPIQPPRASIDDHTFYVNSSHGDFVVHLVDEDGQVVYTTFMPSAVSSIYLPATLSGSYMIQLYWGDWLFYGYITL